MSRGSPHAGVEIAAHVMAKLIELPNDGLRDENENGNFRFSRIVFKILSTFKAKSK